MSLRSTSTLNPTLTNYAQGVAQDRRSAIADFLAPIVPVSASIGQYKRFDSKNAFAVYDTARAIGGPATRIKFAADDPTFNCKPQALEIGIDDAERDAAGAGDPLGIEQAKLDTLISNAVIAREVKVVTAVKAGLAAVAGKGVWSSAANDPVAELDEQILAIATATGIMPNAIAFGVGAWSIFRNHPKVVSRQPGAELIGLTTDQAVRMTLNPGIEIRVGILSKDAAKWGNTKNAANIVGLEVFIFQRSAVPNQYDPSFAKTFTIGAGLVAGVREYRDESARSDIYAMDWSEDIQMVSTECARRLTIA
jgi:hypothetical protein